jgi:molybdenum cofactor cytidylyltransferase
MTVLGLLLAAGASRRFAGPKLTQPLADGTPVCLAAARNLRLALGEVLAVLRSGDGELAAVLASEPGVRTLICAEAELGMGHSLACGVRASAGSDGWIIALGDMPWVRPATIAQVARCLRDGAPIVAPECQGRRGHPVGFGADFGPALMALCGDLGARRLLRRHAALVHSFDCDDRGCLADVDRPQDLVGKSCRGAC